MPPQLLDTSAFPTLCCSSLMFFVSRYCCSSNLTFWEVFFFFLPIAVPTSAAGLFIQLVSPTCATTLALDCRCCVKCSTKWHSCVFWKCFVERNALPQLNHFPFHPKPILIWFCEAHLIKPCIFIFILYTSLLFRVRIIQYVSNVSYFMPSQLYVLDQAQRSCDSNFLNAHFY